MITNTDSIDNVLNPPPTIIQGGMGVGVSNWILAQAVATTQGLGRNRALGVISGTAVDISLIRRLNNGDEGGHLLRAMEAFPFPEIAGRVYKKYFIQGGKAPDQPFDLISQYRLTNSNKLLQLTTLANFVEVYLAKEGHSRPIGVNFLEKIQMQHLPELYGAMLAGVDAVLMGAGIPGQIPGVLDAYANGDPALYTMAVEGGTRTHLMHFDPKEVLGEHARDLKRPDFFPIVASNSLAKRLVNNASGRIDGLIIEGDVAGGHNAPPRGKNYPLNERGEPIYGDRDYVDLQQVIDLGLPVWAAGGYDSPEKLQEALDAGLTGIQVGSLFALCEESGIEDKRKQQLLERAREGDLDVFTDPRASPTGFPFKIVRVEGTNSEQEVYEARTRICDLGYLRVPYENPEGKIGYRCASEPVKNWIKKGGDPEATEGRKCICNGLAANIGLAQVTKDGTEEKDLFTGGDSINSARRLLKENKSYSATEVIDYLLGE